MWRSVSAAELGTLIKGLALGVTGSVLFVLIGFRFERFSRGVFIIDALVAWFLAAVREEASVESDGEPVPGDAELEIAISEFVDAAPQRLTELKLLRTDR